MDFDLNPLDKNKFLAIELAKDKVKISYIFFKSDLLIELYSLIGEEFLEEK